MKIRYENIDADVVECVSRLMRTSSFEIALTLMAIQLTVNHLEIKRNYDCIQIVRRSATYNKRNQLFVVIGYKV